MAEKNKAKIERMEEHIDELTLQRVEALLEIDSNTIEREEFDKRLQQAKLGMVFVRDREVMKRVTSAQYIRVVNLIAVDSEERKKYISASMPEMQLVVGE